MPINIGDAVMTFLGDTTQLHEAMQQVGTDAAEKLGPAAAQVQGFGKSFTAAGGDAAEAAVSLKTAQVELSAALAAASRSGGDTAENLARLAVAEEEVVKASATAKLTMALLRTELIANSEAGRAAAASLEAAAVAEKAAGLAARQAGTEHGFWGETLGEVQSKLFGMFAALAVVESVKAFTEEIVHNIVELDNLHLKTGINITTLAGLEERAKELGVGFESVSTALVRLSRSHTLALEGNKAMVTGFERLGISMQELRSLTPEELFFRVASAMHDAKNAGDATASSIALLGKGGAALIPIFSQNTEELRKYVHEAGEASGINDEAAVAARSWEEQTAKLSHTFHAAMVPAIEVALPLFKALLAAGANTWLVFKELGGVIVTTAELMAHAVVTNATVMNDVIHGDFTKAVADVKVGQEQMTAEWRTFTTLAPKMYKDSMETIKDIWKDGSPLAPMKQDFEDTANRVHKSSKDMQTALKAVLDNQLANIENERAQSKLLLAEKKINISQWVDSESKAASDIRNAHEQYFTALIAGYTKLKEPTKARAAEQELEASRLKDQTKLLLENAAAVKSRDEENLKYAVTSAKAASESDKMFKELQKTTLEAVDQVTELERRSAFTPQIKQVLDLNTALKQLNIQGFLPLNLELQQAMKAEKLLNDTGVRGGQIWLEVQAAKLKAIIAIQGAEGKASRDEISQLKQVEAELKKYGKSAMATQITFSDMVQKMKDDARELPAAIGDAFTAVFEGQKSLAEAMIELTAHMIAKMAQQWAEYFFAMAIADIWGNPAKGSAEFAAAAALLAISGALGAVGNSSNSSTGSSSTSNLNGNDNSPATQAQPAPTGGQNVPRLAAGGLITAPTLALVGDSRSGGSSREAVIPLDDRGAVDSIAASIADRMGGRGDVHFHIDGMISPDNLTKVIKKMDRQIAKRQGRLTAGNSFRLTRRG